MASGVRKCPDFPVICNNIRGLTPPARLKSTPLELASAEGTTGGYVDKKLDCAALRFGLVPADATTRFEDSAGASLGCQKIAIAQKLGMDEIGPRNGFFFQWHTGQGCLMNMQLDEFKTPPRKLLSKLLTSRDKLRNKYQAVREQLRVAQNQVRAVENSRQLWKDRAISAEKEVDAIKKNFAERCCQSGAGVTN
ncbi:MAG: hypothetical protein H7Z17_10935 [Fuerstia sp.]|nr:hypothetical protein [Fuerstiella sp.]